MSCKLFSRSMSESFGGNIPAPNRWRPTAARRIAEYGTTIARFHGSRRQRASVTGEATCYDLRARTRPITSGTCCLSTDSRQALWNFGRLTAHGWRWSARAGSRSEAACQRDAVRTPRRLSRRLRAYLERRLDRRQLFPTKVDDRVQHVRAGTQRWPRDAKATGRTREHRRARQRQRHHD